MEITITKDSIRDTIFQPIPSSWSAPPHSLRLKHVLVFQVNYNSQARAEWSIDTSRMLLYCEKLLDWLKLLPSKWARNNLPANMTHEEAEELSTTITCTTTCTLAADYKVSENSHVKQWPTHHEGDGCVQNESVAW